MPNKDLEPRRFRIPLILLLLAACLTVGVIGVVAQEDAPHDAVSTLGTPIGTPHYLPLIGGGADALPGDVIPDQWIVVYKSAEVRAAGGDATAAAELSTALVSAAGGELLYTYTAALEGFAARLPADAIAAITADARVDYVEPDRVVRLDPAANPALQGVQPAAPDATQRPATWGLDRIDQRSLPLNNRFIYNTTGQGVNVYIIDSGIRPTHNEFAGRIGRVLYTIEDGNQGIDCNGHGTHVAGTAAGTTWGVAKRATIHSIRVLDCEGSGKISGIISAIDWVRANHVKPAVVNMSLGGEGTHAAQEAAVRNLVAAGVTVVVAAGNDGLDACDFTPARIPEAITVGNTDADDFRYQTFFSGSNYGRCLDIFAPGTDITSAHIGSNTATEQLTGTSMASPHVAGAVALFLQRSPNASPAQVLAALLNNATTNIVKNRGAGSPDQLLYTGFIGAPPPTPRPTATATRPPSQMLLTIFVRSGRAPTPTLTPILTPTRTPVAPTATPTRTPTPTMMPGTATPTFTPSPTLSPTPSPTPSGTPPSCTNLLDDSSFEQMPSAWTQASSTGSSLICTEGSCGQGVPPHTGEHVAWLGGLPDEMASVSQSVTIPAGMNPVLAYWYWIGSEDICGWDFGRSVVQVGSNTPQLLAGHDLCADANTGGWVRQTVNMSAFAGQTVQVGFEVETDLSNNSNFFIDDASLYSAAECVPAASAAVENAVPAPVATPQPGDEKPAHVAPRPAVPGAQPRLP